MGNIVQDAAGGSSRGAMKAITNGKVIVMDYPLREPPKRGPFK